MEIRFLVKVVYESLKKCKSTCNNCPHKKLKDFINKVGVDKFCQLYETERLSDEIKYTFEERAKSIIL